MAIIDTSIEIARPPAEVRAVVLDFENMHTWHKDFLKIMKPLPEGTKGYDMKQGDDMKLKFLQVTSMVKCAANTPEELAWEGGPGMLFHGRHHIRFESINGGQGTKVINGETFTGLFGMGVALPGIHGSVAKLYDGYNRDLKKRCEEGPPVQAPKM